MKSNSRQEDQTLKIVATHTLNLPMFIEDLKFIFWVTSKILNGIYLDYVSATHFFVLNFPGP